MQNLELPIKKILEVLTAVWHLAESYLYRASRREDRIRERDALVLR